MRGGQSFPLTSSRIPSYFQLCSLMRPRHPSPLMVSWSTRHSLPRNSHRIPNILPHTVLRHRCKPPKNEEQGCPWTDRHWLSIPCSTCSRLGLTGEQCLPLTQGSERWTPWWFCWGCWTKAFRFCWFSLRWCWWWLLSWVQSIRN